MCTEQIKEIVYEMLTENTGQALGDSGGRPIYDENGKYIRSEYGYGRHWERNKGKTLKDFEKENPVDIWLNDYGIDVSVSVFHYLTTNSNLELDDVCEVFNKLNFLEDIEECDVSGFYQVNEIAYKYLKTLGYKEIGHGFNTYNGDSHLTQVLQGQYLDINGNTYLLLQVHGGMDIRGGFCTPRLFLCQEGYISSDINDYIETEQYEYYDIYSKRLDRNLNEQEKQCLIGLLNIRNLKINDDLIENIIEICDINNYLIGEDKQLELKYPLLESQIKRIRNSFIKEQTEKVYELDFKKQQMVLS